MKGWLHSVLVGILALVRVSAGPTDIDESFRYADTNMVDIRDIELFPDGSIAYGGRNTSRGLVGKLAPDGTFLFKSSTAAPGIYPQSVATDRVSGAIYSAEPFGLIYSAVSQYGPSSHQMGNRQITGSGLKVLVQPDRKVLLAGGPLGLAGDTNVFGLLRLDHTLAVDPAFTFTNSSGIIVTTAALLANGGILAGYQFTNESGTVYGLGRWDTNGVRDLNYAAPTPLVNEGRVTVIEKAPGTNGVILAIERVDGGSALVHLDETGSLSAGTDAPLVEVKGRVHAIAFEAVRPDTAARRDFDRIIMGGEFTQVGDTSCNNLAAISREGLVEWSFRTNEGPNGAILALAVQPDGKVLIAGAFANVSGFPQGQVARLMGNNSTNQTYLFWADAETRMFEKLGSGELELVRSGNTNETLSVTLSAKGPLGAMNFPAHIEFARGESVVKVPVTISNDTLRQNRRSFTVSASVTDTNVILTRAETDLVILDDETPGTLNPAFMPDMDPVPPGSMRPRVETFAVQKDGKILIAINTLTSGGYFPSSPGLLRLNSDGSRDSEFAVSSRLSGEIRQILPQPDGKIYVAGFFTTGERLPNTPGVAGQPFNHLVRLNADGTVDHSFNPRLAGGPIRSEHRGLVAALFGNGDLAVWPSVDLDSVNNTQVRMMRLDPAGNVVTVYTNSSRWNFLGAAVECSQDDGVFLESSSRPLMKFNSAGLVDTNFVLNLNSGLVSAIRAVNDSLFIGGDLVQINDHAVSTIARVSIETGALDTNFHPEVNGPVRAIEEKNGMIYIAGPFTVVNGQDRAGVARLHADGSLDESFDPGFGANYPLDEIKLTAEGDLFVGNSFDRFDGVTIPFVAMLEGHLATTPPVVSLTAPNNDDTFLTSDTITFTALTVDGGSVTKVVFFAGETKIGEDASAPYSVTSTLSAGTHSITAKATDNQGATTTSSAVSITVNAPNQPPTVALTAPSNGATFLTTDTITFSADATDNGAVAKVEFFAGDSLIGTDTSSPYSVTSALPAGTHSITAKATDNTGSTTTSGAVSITVNAPNQPPTVNLTAPANGTTFLTTDTITFSADASDNGAVAKIEFFAGDTLIGTDDSSPYSVTGTLPAGTHSITAKATDNIGSSTTSGAVSITVQFAANQPPVVTLTNPLGGLFTVPVSILLRATATDSDGNIAQVEFFNGTSSLGVDSTQPFELAQNDLAAGVYMFSAVATDNSGARATSEVRTVNAAAQPGITSVTGTGETTTLNVEGTTGVPHILEGSFDLISWSGIATNTLVSGSAVFTDSANQPSKFYRVIVR